MTYTVALRSPHTGEIGVALTTCSIAVGGLCLFHSSKGDLVVSQAFASPSNGMILKQALDQGRTPQAAFDLLGSADRHISYRQILVIPLNGAIFAHTGSDCRSWSGHLAGDDYVVAGNVLAGRQVIEAMQNAVLDTQELDLPEQLLRTLEEGRKSGGQAAGDGRPLAERSAAIKITDTRSLPGLTKLDLRVDMHFSALHELRRLMKFHEVYGAYSELRDKNPPESPSMVQYEHEWIGRDGGVVERPSVFR